VTTTTYQKNKFLKVQAIKYLYPQQKKYAPKATANQYGT
jgi:hypothetical protein